MVPDDEARAAAREILDRPEYARWHSEYEDWLDGWDALLGLVPDFLIEALAWIWEVLIQGLLLRGLEWMGGWLLRLGLFGPEASPLGWLSVGLLLTAAIVLWKRRALRKATRRRSRPDHSDSAPSHAEALREARSLAEEGRTLEAAHRVQLATLARLIERGRLELGRADPNRTLRRRVRASTLPPAEQARLIELVDRLEALWFDDRREDRALFEDWIALDARLAALPDARLETAERSARRAA